MQSSTSSPEIPEQRLPNVQVSPTSSSRILYHVPCKVCRDHSSGKHYGIYACDGCAGFFKRSIRRARQYVCKSNKQGLCIVDKTHRNQCRSCRLRKCFDVGMNREAVQHERGPRNSTLRRHIALYKDAVMGSTDMTGLPHDLLINPSALGYTNVLPPNGHPMFNNIYQPQVVLDLSMPRVSPHHFYAPTAAYMNAYATRALPPTPPLMATEHIKETAAAQIFKNLNWIKNEPSFVELPFADQLQLLADSWSIFFVIATSQYLYSINFAQLLQVYETEDANQTNKNKITYEANIFQSVINQMSNLRVDSTEYECLRAISLFRKPRIIDELLINPSFNGCENAGNSHNGYDVIEAAKLTALHDEAKSTLHTYTLHTHPSQPTRYQNILGILGQMNGVTPFTIEELFFRKTIGSLTIVKIISDIYCQSNA